MKEKMLRNEHMFDEEKVGNGEKESWVRRRKGSLFILLYVF